MKQSVFFARVSACFNRAMLGKNKKHREEYNSMAMMELKSDKNQLNSLEFFFCMFPRLSCSSGYFVYDKWWCLALKHCIISSRKRKARTERIEWERKKNLWITEFWRSRLRRRINGVMHFFDTNEREEEDKKKWKNKK